MTGGAGMTGTTGTTGGVQKPHVTRVMGGVRTAQRNVRTRTGGAARSRR